MNYKLIAIDMDGTLLNSKSKISAANKQAVTEAVKQGTQIVICTGRPYKEALVFAKELGLNQTDQYIIDYGGSMIQDDSGKVIYQKVLRNQECTDIAQTLFANKINYHLIDTKGNLYDSDQDWTEKRMLQPKLSILKFLVSGHKGKIAKWAEFLHEQYDSDYFVVKTSPKEVELCPKNVNKGTALEHLIKYLKLKPNQVAAIGDMDNDLPMMKVAGLSIAMGNANDNIKQACDVETLDNDHDGVSATIEKYILEK
ncbi:Cof-like hydrolase [Companilactobacillus mindensis DSM 14500]|uniref:Cof-like hydrolase n=1 Tax=Companilactobacillus mindensis DSM 14500 TaxID=1423770 RepID=A0A0R1QUK3_9LACO|nr:Cof-type HAD-IIB family hydrolase [Companilactobacillus mindensis]KRL45925.1 Cof-like hydrolase [Companilactobacillus mindensis DSM 14500]GEO77788.1 sugar phosphate phosphatase [Companilactobacillus mindensis]